MTIYPPKHVVFGYVLGTNQLTLLQCMLEVLLSIRKYLNVELLDNYNLNVINISLDMLNIETDLHTVYF